MRLREHKYKSIDVFTKSIADVIEGLGLKGYSWKFWNKDDSFLTLRKSWDFDYSERGINHYFRNYWISSIIHETGISIWNHVYNESGPKFSTKDQDLVSNRASEFRERFFDSILQKSV